jgi:hypothetical protein
MGNWRRTGWLLSQVAERLAHPLRSGCTARHTVSFTVQNTGQVAGTEVRIIFFVPNQPIYSACEKK